MIGKVLRWGNSYGIRLSKADVDKQGLHEGEEVVFELRVEPGRRIDASSLHFFRGDGDLSVRHDEYDWA